MPTNPETSYSELWEGYDVFFGKRKRLEILSYEETKEIVQLLSKEYGINTIPKLMAWRNGEIKDTPVCPAPFPASPTKTFKDQIVSLDDFFGREAPAPLISYQEAKDWVIAQKFKTRDEFYKADRPEKIKATPEKLYKSEWEGWETFLGKRKTKLADYMPYEKAKKWCQKNLVKYGINSFYTWYDYRKGLFPDAPALPETMRLSIELYPEWEGWDTFFDKEKYYKFENTDTDKIIELYNEGKTLKEIAEICDCNISKVSRATLEIANRFKRKKIEP
jgi:hypothetical protein